MLLTKIKTYLRIKFGTFFFFHSSRNQVVLLLCHVVDPLALSWVKLNIYSCTNEVLLATAK